MNNVVVPAPFVHASIKRRKNTWYSVVNGLWSNRFAWLSNGFKRWNYPWHSGQVDDVYINHTVTTEFSTRHNNMYVSGTWLWLNAGVVSVYVHGDLQATGTVNMTSSTSATLYLYGVNNYVKDFIAGSASVYYMRLGTQPIAIMTYWNLVLYINGIKYAQTDVLVNGNLYLGGFGDGNARNVVMQLGDYNLTVMGTTNPPGSIEQFICTITKTGPGTVLFVGNWFLGNTGNTSTANCVDFSGGNPTVEIRGGMSWQNATFNMMRSGTGLWSFTTNNQILNPSGGVVYFDCPMLIVGTITITITNLSGGIAIIQPINGTAAGTVVNKGVIYFRSTAAVATAWTLTTLDRASFDNILGYIFAGDYTLDYTTYSGLLTSSTGLKSLMGNTVLSYTLNIQSATANTAGLECGSYNLDVANTTTITSGILKKSGSGSILFRGQLAITQNGYIDFSGNPTVELRGGINFIHSGVQALNMGTQPWTFTTNNQSLSGGTNMSGNFLISGAITITQTFTINFIGTINGNNAASTYDNRGTINWQNSTIPMVTGILLTDAAANIFKYNKFGNQDVRGGTYRTIEFGGSGIKKLLGNVIVNVTAGGGQSTTGSATIDTNGFSITTI